MLPASAYPVQIVQAQRWLDKNKALVAKNDYSGIDIQNWDSAVKALARFPGRYQADERRPRLDDGPRRRRSEPAPGRRRFYRILTAQGPAAPGGAFSYLINRHMIAGHAMIAWPATYGDSGVETFICGDNGVVYQKDLGPYTAALGASMAQFNPDATWNVVE